MLSDQKDRECVVPPPMLQAVVTTEMGLIVLMVWSARTAGMLKKNNSMLSSGAGRDVLALCWRGGLLALPVSCGLCRRGHHDVCRMAAAFCTAPRKPYCCGVGNSLSAVVDWLSLNCSRPVSSACGAAGAVDGRSRCPPTRLGQVPGVVGLRGA